jgi:phosphoribosyl 1,2-cyclic phosphate phosphodiesterase
LNGLEAVILGCGPAGGVPSIAHGWGACDPNNPLNRRRRPSLLVRATTDEREARFLVDASPDFREQALGAGIRALDAVFITHVHADHTHGIDDLRDVNRVMKAAIDLWARPEDLAELDGRFGYCFTPLAPEATSIYKPLLVPRALEPGRAVRPVDGLDLEVVGFTQGHGWSTTLGLRFGPLAYSTDAVTLDAAAFAALEGVDTWIVDCFTTHPHPTHAHLELVLGWIERVKPRRAILTHMGPGLDHGTLRGLLPDHVEPAHDGMVISVPLEP